MLSPLTVSAKSDVSADNTMADFKRLKLAIEQAVADFEKTPMNEFSYRVTRYENEEGTETSSVEAFSPQTSEANQWSLLQKNQRAPTFEEQQAFASQKQNQHSHTVVKLSELIVFDSLTTKVVTDSAVHADFDVQFERLGANTSSYLKGTLVYDVNNKFITTIDITNTESFSPVFAATIDKLEVTMSFTKQQEIILPLNINMSMQGRFAFLSKINETSSDSYSNFRYVGPADSHSTTRESAK
ncbi:hypothetical protein [Alteromonas gracilis]|uniref:hypothetical protein n=1 Tax=Alteromonas gracilis TaxID=1479524 RepID=UPI0037354B0E